MWVNVWVVCECEVGNAMDCNTLPTSNTLYHPFIQYALLISPLLCVCVHVCFKRKKTHTGPRRDVQEAAGLCRLRPQPVTYTKHTHKHTNTHKRAFFASHPSAGRVLVRLVRKKEKRKGGREAFVSSFCASVVDGPEKRTNERMDYLPSLSPFLSFPLSRPLLGRVGRRVSRVGREGEERRESIIGGGLYKMRGREEGV